MSLLHRIKSPFSEPADEGTSAPEWPVHAVGDMLRERREELGLDLEAAGSALRIKAIYLAALEEGRPQDLPGPTYAVGFIRAYAQYLGFDAAWMLDRYKAEATEVQLRPDLSLPVPLSERSVPGGPILLVAVILALCGYGTWYYLSTSERSRPERVAAVPAELQRSVKSDHAAIVASSGAEAKAATTPPVAAAAAGNAPATAGNAPAAGTDPRLASGLAAADPAAAASQDRPEAKRGAGDPPAGAAPAGSGVIPVKAAMPPPGDEIVSANAPPAQPSTNDGALKSPGPIEIRALADCWVQLRTADQTVVFSRVLKAGETYRVAQPGLVMRAANAGALAIAVGGKPVPAIGPVGTLRRDIVLDPGALLAGTAVKG